MGMLPTPSRPRSCRTPSTRLSSPPTWTAKRLVASTRQHPSTGLTCLIRSAGIYTYIQNKILLIYVMDSIIYVVDCIYRSARRRMCRIGSRPWRRSWTHSRGQAGGASRRRGLTRSSTSSWYQLLRCFGRWIDFVACDTCVSMASLLVSHPHHLLATRSALQEAYCNMLMKFQEEMARPIQEATEFFRSVERQLQLGSISGNYYT